VKDIEGSCCGTHEAQDSRYLISSAGGDGTNFTSMSFAESSRYRQEARLALQVASIHADIDKGHISRELKAGRIEPLRARARRATARDDAAHPWSWRRWAPRRFARRSKKAKVSRECCVRTVLRSLCRPRDGDPRRLRSGARWHRQDHGMRALCASRSAATSWAICGATISRSRPLIPPSAAPRPRCARHHTQEKDQSRPAGRPTASTLDLSMQVRAE